MKNNSIHNSQVSNENVNNNYDEKKYDGCTDKMRVFYNKPVIQWKIISLTLGELLIMIFLIALIFILHIIHYMNQGFGKQDPKTTGVLASIPLFLAQITCLKNSIFFSVLGISYKQIVFWHQIFGFLALVSGILHAITSEKSKPGAIALFGLIGLNVLAVDPIKKHLYQLFAKSHILFAIVLSVGIVLHRIGLGYLGILFIAIDYACRMYQSLKYRNSFKNVNIVALNETIVKISFQQYITYEPAQHFFYIIPKASFFESHPISIASSPYQEQIYSYVKILGDWTGSLHKVAKQHQECQAILHGPYGKPQLNLHSNRYQYYVFIGGGIGIAPILSHIKQLIYNYKKGKKIQKILMIWSSNKIDDFDIFNEEKLDSLLSPIDQESDLLSFSLHLTGQDQQTNQNQNLNLKKGRPNIIKLIKEKFNNNEKIALMSCCADKMQKGINEAIFALRKNNYQIDF